MRSELVGIGRIHVDWRLDRPRAGLADAPNTKLHPSRRRGIPRAGLRCDKSSNARRCQHTQKISLKFGSIQLKINRSPCAQGLGAPMTARIKIADGTPPLPPILCE